MLQSGVGGTQGSKFVGCGSVQRGTVGAGVSGLLRRSEQVCWRRCRPDSTTSDLLATFQHSAPGQRLFTARNQPIPAQKQMRRRRFAVYFYYRELQWW